MPLLISDFVIFTLDHLEKLYFRNISERNSGLTNLSTMIISGYEVMQSKHQGGFRMAVSKKKYFYWLKLLNSLIMPKILLCGKPGCFALIDHWMGRMSPGVKNLNVKLLLNQESILSVSRNFMPLS